jgi:uncharacterized protein
MKRLHLAENLSLPLEAVTQAIGILAKRRAGKSYAARRFTEQLFKSGQQVVIVDPKGDWWGIRSSADGRGPGLPIVIIGGERGDVPLEVGGGDVVAKLVVEERVSVLLDLSLLRKHEVATFMADFLESLYRLKAREQYRSPMMLIVDEADAIAPQSTRTHGVKGGNVERMLGAAEDIVRRGGQRGIGCTLITQRSAVLNKNVLTQIQMLVVLRTISPQDLEAIDAWIDVHGTDDERKILKASLPSLPIGDAWFWSPGWPTVDGIFERAHILPIETFDSGATPKPGEKRIAPKNLADVDLDALSRQMAETIEKAKAENPKELQKKIRELEANIKRLERAKPAAASTKTVEKPVVDSKILKRIEKLAEHLHKLLDRASEFVAALNEENGTLNGSLSNARFIASAAQPTEIAEPAVARTAVPPRSTPKPQLRLNGDLAPRQQAIIDALRELEQLGLSKPPRSVVAVFAGRGPSSSSYDNDLGHLRTARGYIDYPSGGALSLTDAGRSVANEPAELRSLSEFHQAWFSHLEPRKVRILQALIKSYPNPIDRDKLAELSGRGGSSSSYDNDLSSLRTLGVIDYPAPRMVAATELLFPRGLN